MMLFLVWTLNHPYTHLEVTSWKYQGQAQDSKYKVGIVDRFYNECAPNSDYLR